MLANSKFWALLRKDYGSAGDLYYREGRFARASELYARAGRLEQAAEIALENGDLGRAVELFLQAGSPRRAGEAMAHAGDHRGAVPHFDAAGAYLQAAESSLKMNRAVMAGRYFERAEAYRRAAECFDESGERESAARAWALEAERLKALRGSEDTSVRLELEHVNATRAKLLEEVGRFVEAADVLRELGNHRKAGHLYERGRAYDRAVESFVEGAAFTDAGRLLPRTQGVSATAEAKILYHTGDYEGAGALFEKLGELEDAVEAYELAGKSLRAAVLWRKLGFFESAAGHYSSAGLHMEAAGCFEEAGDHAAAARAYDEANAPRRAAHCYEQLGMDLVAAQRYLMCGEETSADRLLQRFTPKDPDYGAATFLLVPLFIKDGLFEPALVRLAGIVGVQSTSSAVEKHYWEGRAHDGLKQYSRATARYRKASALDPDFHDLAKRMADSEIQESLKTREFAADGAVSDDDTTTQGWWARPGEVIAGRYSIVREVGRGGMSRVYEALDRQIDERIAIKILVPQADGEHRAENRLLQEVRICRKISHPNVVKVFDFGRFASGVFITMELLHGQTLEERIREAGPLSFSDTRDLFEDIVEGLAEAHRQKVIHRDLKPMNVFLTPDGTKIMDFGIARIEDQDPKLTRTGHVIGSPLFMSPEQLQGQEVDYRTDLYSLGILLFYVVTGRTPFTGRTSTALALKHLGEMPPRLSSLRADTPEPWDTFVARLLKKKPDQRFESIFEVQVRLRSLPV